MSKPTIKPLVAIIAGGILFALGVLVGANLPSTNTATSTGAYFCCDQKPCVISTDGDCKLPIKWCSVVKKTADGASYCAQW